MGASPPRAARAQPSGFWLPRSLSLPVALVAPVAPDAPVPPKKLQATSATLAFATPTTHAAPESMWTCSFLLISISCVFMSEDKFNTRKTEETTNSWLTPPAIVKALGHFDLDPCTPPVMPWELTPHRYTEADDGLRQPWHGRCFLNPPYGVHTFKWLARLADHKRGIALIFARTETEGFQNEVFGKAHSLLFKKGRIRFHREDGSLAGTPGAPSVFVSYSEEDTAILAASGIAGKLVFLRQNSPLSLF
jgi:hypothetical protein